MSPAVVVLEDARRLSSAVTRKSPEQRRHDISSIVFGCHLAAEGKPALFAHDDEEVELFLCRELHEELGFSPPPRRASYVGVLHLTGSAFERQHAGVVFAIDL